MRFFLVFFFSFFLFISSINSPAQITPSEAESLEVIEEEQLLITNVFYETEIREALAAISAQTGINIIPDQTVSGFISMELIDVPFEEALRRILSPLGFTFRKMVGYYLVESAFPDAQITPSEPESLEVFEEQPLITNVFYENDIREALAAISGQSGINIIADQTVYGFISMELMDVPFEEALSRILSPLGFTFRRMVGYYLVGAAYPDNPSFPLLSVTERVVPNYLKAKSVPGLLSSFYQPFLKYDTETNTLVITASPEIMQRIKEDLAKIDVPPRQVMIEALITEFSKEARKSLGMDLGWFGEKDGRDLSVIVPIGDLLDSTLGIRYLRPDAKFEGWVGEFKGTLKALVEDGKVNIRANPRVATLEGQKATILIGKEQYYVIVTGVAPYSYGHLERIPVGVSLQIVPYISDKDEITVEIHPEVSDVVGTGATGLPVVSKRAVSTKIRVKDGETIVIGGLLQKNESIVKRKIPLLGDIPILGLLFSRTDKRVNEVETVIFITPHILTEETKEAISETSE